MPRNKGSTADSQQYNGFMNFFRPLIRWRKDLDGKSSGNNANLNAASSIHSVPGVTNSNSLRSHSTVSLFQPTFDNLSTKPPPRPVPNDTFTSKWLPSVSQASNQSPEQKKPQTTKIAQHHSSLYFTDSAKQSFLTDETKPSLSISSELRKDTSYHHSTLLNSSSNETAHCPSKHSPEKSVAPLVMSNNPSNLDTRNLLQDTEILLHDMEQRIQRQERIERPTTTPNCGQGWNGLGDSSAHLTLATTTDIKYYTPDDTLLKKRGSLPGLAMTSNEAPFPQNAPSFPSSLLAQTRRSAKASRSFHMRLLSHSHSHQQTKANAGMHLYQMQGGQDGEDSSNSFLPTTGRDIYYTPSNDLMDSATLPRLKSFMNRGARCNSVDDVASSLETRYTQYPLSPNHSGDKQVNSNAVVWHTAAPHPAVSTNLIYNNKVDKGNHFFTNGSHNRVSRHISICDMPRSYGFPTSSMTHADRKDVSTPIHSRQHDISQRNISLKKNREFSSRQEIREMEETNSIFSGATSAFTPVQRSRVSSVNEFAIQKFNTSETNEDGSVHCSRAGGGDFSSVHVSPSDNGSVPPRISPKTYDDLLMSSILQLSGKLMQCSGELVAKLKSECNSRTPSPTDLVDPFTDENSPEMVQPDLCQTLKNMKAVQLRLQTIDRTIFPQYKSGRNSTLGSCSEMTYLQERERIQQDIKDFCPIPNEAPRYNLPSPPYQQGSQVHLVHARYSYVPQLREMSTDPNGPTSLDRSVLRRSHTTSNKSFAAPVVSSINPTYSSSIASNSNAPRPVYTNQSVRSQRPTTMYSLHRHSHLQEATP